MNTIGRARNARLNQAEKHMVEVAECLARLRGKTMNEVAGDKDAWGDGRNALEKLVQCFHEANAYNNALVETI